MRSGKILATIFSLCLFLFSCSKEAPDEPESKVLFIDEELAPYFESFRQAASSRGIVVDFEELEIEGQIENIRERDILGQCRVNSNLPDVVAIDEGYWNTSDEMEREFIVFHELGHCVLGRDHLDSRNVNGTCVSIMHSGSGRCRLTYNEETRENYLDELFAN